MWNKTKIFISLWLICLIWFWIFYFLNKKKESNIKWIDYKYSVPQEEITRKDQIVTYYDRDKAQKFLQSASNNDKKEFVFRWNEFMRNNNKWIIEFSFNYKSFHNVEVILRTLDIDADLNKIEKEDIFNTFQKSVITSSNWEWYYREETLHEWLMFVQIRDWETWKILKQFTILPTEENDKKLNEDKRYLERVERYKENLKKQESTWTWSESEWTWWSPDDMSFEEIFREIDEKAKTQQ